MFIHSVYFWLKPELSTAEQNQFWTGVQSLTTIASVKFGYVGAPADTDRPIIDRSYSCALITGFESQEAHDQYQVDPIHDRFRDECGALWNKVLIYDAETK